MRQMMKSFAWLNALVDCWVLKVNGSKYAMVSMLKKKSVIKKARKTNKLIVELDLDKEPEQEKQVEVEQMWITLNLKA